MPAAPRLIAATLILLAVAGCGGGSKTTSGSGKGLNAAVACLKAGGFPQVGIPTELSGGPVPLAHELTVGGGVIDATNSAGAAATLAHSIDVGAGSARQGPAVVEGNVVVYGAQHPLAPAARSVLVRCGGDLRTTSQTAKVAGANAVETHALAVRSCMSRLGIDVEQESAAAGVPSGGVYLGLFPAGGAIAGDADVFADTGSAAKAEAARRANRYFVSVTRKGTAVLALAAPLAPKASALEHCL